MSFEVINLDVLAVQTGLLVDNSFCVVIYLFPESSCS
jgi:hypothetical protein